MGGRLALLGRLALGRSLALGGLALGRSLALRGLALGRSLLGCLLGRLPLRGGLLRGLALRGRLLLGGRLLGRLALRRSLLGRLALRRSLLGCLALRRSLLLGCRLPRASLCRRHCTTFLGVWGNGLRSSRCRLERDPRSRWEPLRRAHAHRDLSARVVRDPSSLANAVRCHRRILIARGGCAFLRARRT